MINEYDLLQVNPPLLTDTYTPVAHSVLIDIVKEKLDKQNLSITRTRYQANKGMNQMFGVYDLLLGDDETKLNIGFRNSYDKSLAVGLVAGSTVVVCSNLMFKGDIKLLRKHTKFVFNDLENLVETVVNSAIYQYEELHHDKEKMKVITLSKREMSELAGRMFVEEKMLTPTQMNQLAREINSSKEFKGQTLWDFYNHTTEALKLSHPSDIMPSHIKTHSFVMDLV